MGSFSYRLALSGLISNAGVKQTASESFEDFLSPVPKRIKGKKKQNMDQLSPFSIILQNNTDCKEWII